MALAENAYENVLETENKYLYNGKLERSGNPAIAGEKQDDLGLEWTAYVETPAVKYDYG